MTVRCAHGAVPQTALDDDTYAIAGRAAAAAAFKAVDSSGSRDHSGRFYRGL